MCAIIIVIIVIVIGLIFLVGEGGDSGNNTVNSNAPLNEEIIQKLVSFTKVGLAVVSKSYDYSYMNIIFQRNNILIMFKADGVELFDGFIEGARNRGEGIVYDRHLLGKEFTCSVAEYKQWKRVVQIDRWGAMPELNIGIQVGQNNRYYERVKSQLKQMYPAEIIAKVQFIEPTSNQYGSINFSYSED